MKKLGLILDGILIGLLIQRIIHENRTLSNKFIRKIKRYVTLNEYYENNIKKYILSNLDNDKQCELIYNCNFEYVYLKDGVFTFYFNNNEIGPLYVDLSGKFNKI